MSDEQNDEFYGFCDSDLLTLFDTTTESENEFYGFESNGHDEQNDNFCDSDTIHTSIFDTTTGSESDFPGFEQ